MRLWGPSCSNFPSSILCNSKTLSAVISGRWSDLLGSPRPLPPPSGQGKGNHLLVNSESHGQEAAPGFYLGCL